LEPNGVGRVVNASLIPHVVQAVGLEGVGGTQHGEAVAVALVGVPVVGVGQATIPVTTAAVFFHGVEVQLEARVVDGEFLLQVDAHFIQVGVASVGKSPVPAVMGVPGHLVAFALSHKPAGQFGCQVIRF